MNPLHFLKTRKSHTHKSETGQTVVLMAFLIIGLLAITGLAIDGGGVLFMERDLQNAVDSAILAATYAKCTGGDVAHAAHEAARKSGFENGVNGVVVTVNDNPPEGSEFVRVGIQAEKEKYFIQLVYTDPLILSADGAGRCKPSAVNPQTPAIMAACEGTETGIEIQASSTCSGVIKPAIHSNSAAKSNEGMCVEGSDGNPGQVSTSDSGSQLKGTLDGNPLPSSSDEFVPTMDFPFVWELSDFSSSAAKYPARIISQWGSDNYGILPGGMSFDLDAIPSDFAALGLADPRTEPVLLYVNGDIGIAPGSPPVGTVYYLTIVATGQIRANGNLRNASLVNAGEYPVGVNWASGDSDNGMDYLLFFSARDDRDGNCTTSGNTAIDYSVNDVYWRGIIYAPLGDVTISGSSSETSYGAIWAQAVKYAVSGMTLEFDPNILPPERPAITYSD